MKLHLTPMRSSSANVAFEFAARTDATWSSSTRTVNAARDRALHRREEALRGVVEGDDVELDVHERRRGVDVGGHGVDRALVVLDEGRRVAATAGIAVSVRLSCSTPGSQAGQPRHPRRCRRPHALGDHAVDVLCFSSRAFGSL